MVDLESEFLHRDALMDKLHKKLKKQK